MEKILINGAYGNKTKPIEISMPTGGVNAWYITIDRYHHGQMIRYKGEWIGYIHPTSELTGDDIWIIGDLINEKLAGK